MSQNPYAPPAADVQDLEETTTERPRSTTVAVRLLWVTTCIRVTLGAFSLLYRSGFSRSQIVVIAYVMSWGILTAYFGAAFASLSAAGKGRNWGRIVITLLVTINLVVTLWMARSLSEDALWVVMPIALLPAVIELIAIALIFARASNAWYAANRAA